MSDALLDLLRHGEPVGGPKYRGQLDDPLSEHGWAQMWAAVGDSPPWTRIVTSPLARCRPFAEALGEWQGLEVRVDDRLKEVGLGAWQGRARTEVRRSEPELYARFRDDPVRDRPPGAEPLEDFSRRVTVAYDELVAREANEHVLVVAHAGVIRAVMAHVLGIALERFYRIDVPNATLTRLRTNREGVPALLLHGATRVPVE